MNVVERFKDYSPLQREFYDDVIAGLRSSPKQLPCKYFYDETGSQLFDQICQLPEYYPTRTELGLLKKYGPEMAAMAGDEVELIEFGCGSLQKIRVLLSAFETLERFVPIDISKEHLLASAQDLEAEFPDLKITPLCADYTQRIDLHDPEGITKRIGFFPGSTIGNFTHGEAVAFLEVLTEILGKGGELIIGVDLKKDEAILNAAYNDAQGVTAAFNLNLLQRINDVLGGQFDISKFTHKAFYVDDPGRIEMHLESMIDQIVLIGDEQIAFSAGERVHTENSYKYSIDDFVALASKAGFEQLKTWSDDDQLFSIHYLRVTG